MENLIRNFFDRQAVLSEEEWQLFKSKLIKREYKKGDFIIKEGEIEQYLSFQIKGITRMFILKPDGTEISVGFCFENDFSSAYTSFIFQSPSNIYIQCIQECTLLSISKNDLEYAYSVSQTGERLGRINAELFSVFLIERNISLLSESAEERYLKLLENHPQMMQLIPLKYIASYLGVTAESLSRIRKKITQ